MGNMCKRTGRFMLAGIIIWLVAGIFVCPGQYVQAEDNLGQQVQFLSGKPIWPAGREKEMNLFVGFRAVFDKPADSRARLRIAGSTLYRIFLNGEFIGHGPARGPHGYYRVDELVLDGHLKYGRNVLAVEVAGYNVNSYYLLDQPAFLQAEIVSGGKVLASTAGEGSPFKARIIRERVQKVQRYSFQRPFIEYYRLGKGYDHWRWDWSSPVAAVKCAVQPEKNLIIRRVPFCDFYQRQPLQVVSKGKLRQNVPTQNIWKDRSLVNISDKLKGYKESELTVIPSIELQKIRSYDFEPLGKPYQPLKSLSLKKNEFYIMDLGADSSGFIGMEVYCTEPAKLYVTFDELLQKGDVNFRRLGCVSSVCYELQPGRYELESFEPYTMRFLKLNLLEGSCQVEGVYLREYVSPEAEAAQFTCSDRRLNKIFEAARNTFKQNAIDIFMDCPSRERAGWLCDSFFTSRVAYDLCGNTKIEKNFFENFYLPDHFAYLPDGMLPMCYPADHNDGVFIPNWAMWFVVQLEEYLARSGDTEMIYGLQDKLQGLHDYLQRFMNSDGLLEKLDSWVFVEWSKANSFVQNVNYPTNMLYAAALAAAGRMYDEPSLLDDADRMRDVIRRQSFDGEFFVDNAVRQKDGTLQVTRNRTEVCQYFAYYFDVATPETYPKLWKKLLHDFGPQRKKTGAFPEIYPANALVGNYLRLELLSRYGYCKQVKNELVGYYLYMADKTGTLWENVDANASCNHGFASHVAHVFYRDVLGVYRIDQPHKTVTLRFTDVGLDWCEGKMPTPEGPVIVSWWKDGVKLHYRAEVPAGYTLLVKNPGGLQLERE